MESISILGVTSICFKGKGGSRAGEQPGAGAESEEGKLQTAGKIIVHRPKGQGILSTDWHLRKLGFYPFKEKGIIFQRIDFQVLQRDIPGL